MPWGAWLLMTIFATTTTCINHVDNVYDIILYPTSFLLEIRVIIKISKKSLVPHKLWLILIRMKQKKMADSKKLRFSTTTKSWVIFAKILQIGPWVSRIHWCEGHQCDSTYMAVRLSDLSSKKGKKDKKGSFSPFLGLRRTAWQPYRLSHIDALRINQSY